MAKPYSQGEFERALKETYDDRDRYIIESVLDDCLIAILWFENQEIEASGTDIVAFAREIDRRRS